MQTTHPALPLWLPAEGDGHEGRRESPGSAEDELFALSSCEDKVQGVNKEKSSPRSADWDATKGAKKRGVAHV